MILSFSFTFFYKFEIHSFGICVEKKALLSPTKHKWHSTSVYGQSLLICSLSSIIFIYYVVPQFYGHKWLFINGHSLFKCLIILSYVYTSSTSLFYFLLGEFFYFLQEWLNSTFSTILRIALLITLNLTNELHLTHLTSLLFVGNWVIHPLQKMVSHWLHS